MFRTNAYWLIPFFAAVLLIAFGGIGFGEVLHGISGDTAINPLKILVLFISVAVLSIFLDETGFFRYLANAVLKKSGSSQIKLFTAFYITISFVTVFTSNDIIILTFTPFLCHFGKNAKIDPIPYLFSAFVAANTCGMALIIGNPTNIYLATANGIDFLTYLKVMALPTLFAFTAAYFALLLLFAKRLKLSFSPNPEELKIENKLFFYISFALLFLCTLLLAISSYLGIEMWQIAFFSACVLTAAVLLVCLVKRYRPEELRRTLKRIPYQLVPFVLSMFVIVLTLEKYEITAKIAAILGEANTIAVYGVSSVFFANLINNIPMSVLFSAVLQNVRPEIATAGVYAAIIGSNIGAFLTPTGALAGIMWLSVLKKNKIDFSFQQFVKYGLVTAIPVLSAALLGLHISLKG